MMITNDEVDDYGYNDDNAYAYGDNVHSTVAENIHSQLEKIWFLGLYPLSFFSFQSRLWIKLFLFFS